MTGTQKQTNNESNGRTVGVYFGLPPEARLVGDAPYPKSGLLRNLNAARQLPPLVATLSEWREFLKLHRVKATK